jgi:glycosidase
LAEGRSYTAEYRVFHALHQLTDIRKKYDVFHSDAYLRAVDTANQSVLGVIRTYAGETLLGFFNFSPDYQRVLMEAADWQDIVEADREYIRGEYPITEYWMEPYGFRWFLKKD